MQSKGAPAQVPTIIIEDTANSGKKVTARDYGASSLSAPGTTTPQVPDSARSVASTAVPATAVPPPEDEDAGKDLPGSLADKQEPELPEWFQVGWRQVSGIDGPTPTTEMRGKAALNLFLKEQFYGDWYHNAGIIIFVRSLFSTRTIRTSQVISLGGSSVSLHGTFPSWLGLANYRPRLLQHLL
jgi:hypothetical protein